MRPVIPLPAKSGNRSSIFCGRCGGDDALPTIVFLRLSDNITVLNRYRYNDECICIDNESSISDRPIK